VRAAATRPCQSGFRAQHGKEVNVATEETAPQQGLTVKDLLDAGLHFGHQTRRWNPKMKPYIFGKRGGIHILDLTQSLTCLQSACAFVEQLASEGRNVLFVGTKKQAQQITRDTATACGQHYVTQRWLGGTLTNLRTIQGSIRRMREIEEMEKDGRMAAAPKQDASNLRRECERLRRNLSGLANMGSLPGAIFVVDVNREANAVAEANRLKIPVIAIVDTNCDPDPIRYVIPGNDDAMRGIQLVVLALSQAIQKGAAALAVRAAEDAARRSRLEAAAQVQPTLGEAAPKPRTRTPRARKAAAAAAAATETPAPATEPVAPAPAPESAPAPEVTGG
jgi:small subunit ribosomal protein S2